MHSYISDTNILSISYYAFKCDLSFPSLITNVRNDVPDSVRSAEERKEGAKTGRECSELQGRKKGDRTRNENRRRAKVESASGVRGQMWKEHTVTFPEKAGEGKRAKSETENRAAVEKRVDVERREERRREIERKSREGRIANPLFPSAIQWILGCVSSSRLAPHWPLALTRTPSGRVLRCRFAHQTHIA